MTNTNTASEVCSQLSSDDCITIPFILSKQSQQPILEVNHISLKSVSQSICLSVTVPWLLPNYLQSDRHSKPRDFSPSSALVKSNLWHSLHNRATTVAKPFQFLKS